MEMELNFKGKFLEVKDNNGEIFNYPRKSIYYHIYSDYVTLRSLDSKRELIQLNYNQIVNRSFSSVNELQEFLLFKDRTYEISNYNTAKTISHQALTPIVAIKNTGDTVSVNIMQFNTLCTTNGNLFFVFQKDNASTITGSNFTNLNKLLYSNSNFTYTPSNDVERIYSNYIDNSTNNSNSVIQDFNLILRNNECLVISAYALGGQDETIYESLVLKEY